MRIVDLGLMPYRQAWAFQEEVHARVLAGEEDHLLLVEHPPVVTLGRRAGVAANLVASPELLAANGVELVQSDRGGDITFHGPGQLVAYPIIKLARHGLLAGSYVHRLESAVVEVLGTFGINASADPARVGVWVGNEKACAFGVRVKRGVSLHGLALNVSIRLAYFDLIIPCGLAGAGVTSIAKLFAAQSPARPAPEMAAVRAALSDVLLRAFAHPRPDPAPVV